MPKSSRVLLLVLLAAPLTALLLPPARALSQEVQRVLVSNFPDLQKITGSVTVDGTIRHGVPERFQEVAVPPAKPTEIRRLTPGGTLTAEGFTSMAVGLGGQFKTTLPSSGTVGVLLLPDEKPILRAFEDDGTREFHHEITAAADSRASAYFSSETKQLAVAFPRYRIFYYNTTERTVGVNLYVYLAN